MLRQQLVPEHAYIEVVDKITGSQAMIKGTRVPVSIIIASLPDTFSLAALVVCLYQDQEQGAYHE
ncbi:MAG: hypothetical protein ONB14_11215 [candidate division KSB1 bacterium]|nr:hypothetical protein [candidate division KSB1 bacterium]